MLCKIVKGETANMLKEVVGELKAGRSQRKKVKGDKKREKWKE